MPGKGTDLSENENSESDINASSSAPAADTPSLRAALRKARLAQAERTDVIVELREAELTRLELLHDALRPVFDEIPEKLDQFECALVPGDPPRLWLDMLAYVAMGSDKRTYRLIKDMRDGRKVLQETGNASEMADHVTDYLAHRIIERERALESDMAARRQDERDEDGGENAPENQDDNATRRGFSGIAVALSLVLGMVVGAAALFAYGILATAP